MKSIQVTIDEPLLDRLDATVRRLELARSAAIREGIMRWLEDVDEAELDRRHREGYERFPVVPGEFPEADPRVWDGL